MNPRYNDWIAEIDADMQENGALSPLPPLRTELDGVVLKCAADLMPSPVRWLWQYWLALGKLHILAGAPGQGKTTLALGMAATVTIGGRWPDGSQATAGNVLIWSGEDDPADTLLPRLLAAGADRAKCFFIEGARRDGEVVPFDPARDLRQLLAAIEKIGGIRLLVIDPVVSAVAGDSHKNTEVRRALQPLVDLAAACDCAVLGITHFAKGGQGTDPTQRVVGSVAFSAVARVVMVAAKVKGDGETKDARILARTKSNIGPDGGGFHYFLEQSEPLPGIHASHIAWGKAVDGTAREGVQAKGVLIPQSLFEKRAAQTTTTAAGIVPEDFRADQFVGLLRNSMVVQSLGARVLPNLRGDVTIPRQATTSTAQWLAEGDALTDSGMTFNSIGLKPKHVGAITELSRQLLQQSNPSIEALVRDDFINVVSLAIDKALIHGNGVKEPEGLLTAATGTGTLATLSWATVLTVLQGLALKNITPNAWLTHPKVATILRKTLREAGLPG